MRDVREKGDPVRQWRGNGRDQRERGLGVDILIFLLLSPCPATLLPPSPAPPSTPLSFVLLRI